MAAKDGILKQDMELVGSARRVRLPPVGFWSYARQDDYLSQGKLSNLRSLLMFELQQLYGRGEIRLFQDASTIPHGAAWEDEVRDALAQSTFFIAIVTPNFVQSEWCCREISLFLEREKELHRLYPDLDSRSRILPVHYIDVADVEPADPAVLDLLSRLQWFDFRRLRHRDFESEQVREAISELAQGIRNLLNLKVEDPEAARERDRVADAERERQAAAAAEQARVEEEARQREAEEQAALEREAQASRRREAAVDRAEAARKKAEEAAALARQRAEEAEAVARRHAEQAEEAARLLAAEREAAEQARREAAAIAKRLSDAEAAAARQAAEEAQAAADRAQADQREAARSQRHAEQEAQQARIESDAAAARERRLADKVAERREEGANVAAPQDGQPADKKPWLAIAGVLAIALLIGAYLGWPRPQAAPSTEGNGSALAAEAPPADPRAWLLNRWGMDGDCAYLVDIVLEGDSLRIGYGGDVQRLPIQAPREGETWNSIVRTERATYVRNGAGVQVTETGAVSPISYRLDPCPGR